MFAQEWCILCQEEQVSKGFLTKNVFAGSREVKMVGSHSAQRDLELYGILMVANRDTTYMDSFLSIMSFKLNKLHNIYKNINWC